MYHNDGPLPASRYRKACRILLLPICKFFCDIVNQSITIVLASTFHSIAIQPSKFCGDISHSLYYITYQQYLVVYIT